jgi:hypothetical protein
MHANISSDFTHTHKNSSDYFGQSVLREKKITASSLSHDDVGAKIRTRGRNGPVMKIVKN